MKKLTVFQRISDPEHLFSAWEQFRKGKGMRPDVLEFERDLERNIFALARDLRERSYRHGPYSEFVIRDPKVRHVSKAMIRDRVVHHAVFDEIMALFEPTFIAGSFSCRVGKGTHKGVEALERMIRRETRNYTRVCHTLKCDVRKFFDSVDHRILMSVLGKRIGDPDMLWLLGEIVSSYESGFSTIASPKGVPIGNLTSQVFANIYMGVFDEFIKRELKVRRYARYTDDFVIVSRDRAYLESLIAPIGGFLKDRLELDLHPKKVEVRKNTQGIDFLGYVLLPHCRIVRKRTRKRMMRKLRSKASDFKKGTASEDSLLRSMQSYLGILSHADAHKVSERLKNQFWFWKN